MDSTATIAQKPLITLTPSEQKVIKVTGFVLGFGLLGLIGYAVVRKTVKKTQDRKETRKSLDDAEPASYATRLHMAMDGMGTTETTIRAVFRELRDWNHYREVAKAYERKYGTILEDDLEGDLDETELDEIRAIINSLKLPQDRITTQHLKLWTKRLRAAWDTTCWIFSCTDEDAAYSVLEDILKTVDPRGAYRMLETHYERTQHITMQEEAESEMDSSEMEKWNRLKNQILSNRTMIA